MEGKTYLNNRSLCKKEKQNKKLESSLFCHKMFSVSTLGKNAKILDDSTLIEGFKRKEKKKKNENTKQ